MACISSSTKISFSRFLTYQLSVFRGPTSHLPSTTFFSKLHRCLTSASLGTQTPTAPTYDIIIFGASGFTGKYVIKEALKFLNTPSSPLKSLALAGRNPYKLTQALSWATHPDSPPSIPILIADTTDPSSLHRIASQTKLILNCVGPFRLYGEPVVSACVNAGADYLDICGEPEFMERMEASYFKEAVKSGSLVVSACGCDSVPAELGMMFNCKHWVSPAVLNHVEAYLSLESDKKMAMNFGTYKSAVLGVANADKLQEFRRSRPRRVQPNISASAPPKGSTMKHQKEIGLWAVKLPSADATVVRRTLGTLVKNPHGLPGANESTQQAERRENFWSTIKPSHFRIRLGSKSLLNVLRFICVGGFIRLLGGFAFGRWLLLTFPSFFSLGCFRKEGPTEEEVASASFKMWFVGQGFITSSSSSQGNTKSDYMQIITRLTGPEFGYVTTSIILLQCSLILLNQRDNLPKGGVFPPGILFGPTDLQERLQKNGISFDIISKNSLSC